MIKLLNTICLLSFLLMTTLGVVSINSDTSFEYYNTIDIEMENITKILEKDLDENLHHLKLLSGMLEEKDNFWVYNDTDYYYYADKIPKEFLEAFLLMTQSRKELRSTFYSLMVLESGNFTDYIGNLNGNGSQDFGPAQLNNFNIESEWFVRAFFPKEDMLNLLQINDKNYDYLVWMIAAFNFFVDNVDMYNGNIRQALRAYNGGSRVNRSKYEGTKLRATTDAYANKIFKLEEKNDRNYDLFQNQIEGLTTDNLYVTYILEEESYLLDNYEEDKLIALL